MRWHGLVAVIVGGKSTIDICNPRYLRTARNSPAIESEGITTAVAAFMLQPYYRQCHQRKSRLVLQKLIAILRVTLQHLNLILVQLSALVQDLLRNKYLAKIMENSAGTNIQHFVTRQRIDLGVHQQSQGCHLQ